MYFALMYIPHVVTQERQKLQVNRSTFGIGFECFVSILCTQHSLSLWKLKLTSGRIVLKYCQQSTPLFQSLQQHGQIYMHLMV